MDQNVTYLTVKIGTCGLQAEQLIDKCSFLHTFVSLPQGQLWATYKETVNLQC